MRNEQIDGGGLSWKTFPERLQEAGISWKSYQNELTCSGLSGEKDAWLGNYGDNVLECFSAYNVEAYPGYVRAAEQFISELSAHAAKLETEISAQADPGETQKLHSKLADTRSRIESVKASLAKSGEVRYQQLSAPEKALHHAAFVTNAEDPDYHALLPLSFEDQALKRNQGRYDFTVQADGSNQQARYAGRVESGMSGFSDPLMAGVVQAT